MKNKNRQFSEDEIQLANRQVKRMLRITIYKGKANKAHSEFSSDNSQNVYNTIKKKSINDGEDVRENVPC